MNASSKQFPELTALIDTTISHIKENDKTQHTNYSNGKYGNTPIELTLEDMKVFMEHIDNPREFTPEVKARYDKYRRSSESSQGNRE